MSLSLPLDVSPIMLRLQNTLGTDLRSVGTAADYAAVQELRGFTTPSAFVVLADEQPVTDPQAGPGSRARTRQQVLATVGVILAVRNYRTQAGAAAMAEVSPLIGMARDALIGWSPDLALMKQLQWQRGGVLDYDANTLLWIDVYNTTHGIGGGAK